MSCTLAPPRRRAPALAGGYVEIDPTGRYGRFSEVLGKGATKTVYRAFDELNGIEVAWNQAKLCDVLRSPDVLERMKSEVRLLSTLHHDSVIRFLTSWVDVDNRTLNFITEMFTSGTLREYRQKYPNVNIKAIKGWARQILRGLAYLHGQSTPVIHRDLKCDNIFINGHLGQVKIGDLGLAAVLKESRTCHSVIGTPEFMAPELYEENYNELVDIYSFGMCMLEMITTDFPYSECNNPAQIYKKVTSGKLPLAYYRVHDLEARRFVSRCLETACKRPSAEELLLDPFLAFDDNPLVNLSMTATAFLDVYNQHKTNDDVLLSHVDEHVRESIGMTITGKMDPDDETIFLKVQIADDKGQVWNIFFPFDIYNDTPLGVADEMVEQLNITDRDPMMIAGMIEHEVALLVPCWVGTGHAESLQHEYSYGNEGDDESPSYYYLSSPTSSQDSTCGFGPWHEFSAVHDGSHREGWSQGTSSGLSSSTRSQDYPLADDEDMSSTHSDRYSAVQYHSSTEAALEVADDGSSEPHLSSNSARASGSRSIRLCGDEISKLSNSLHKHFCKKCNLNGQLQTLAGAARRGHKDCSGRQLKNRSMVDIRSQLLQRKLLEELNKQLWTVGAVENIGFRPPACSSSHWVKPLSSCGSADHGGGERQKQCS